MIEFNAEKHEYKSNGIVLPCVSDILRDLGFFSGLDKIPIEILNHKANIGTAVHRNIAGSGKMSAEIMPYIIQYHAWEKEYKPKIVKREIPACNSAFCGTPDIEMKDTIIDIKTSNLISVSAFLQVSAYCILNDKKKGFILQLTKKKYEYIEVQVSIYRVLWNQCLNIYNLKRS